MRKGLAFMKKQTIQPSIGDEKIIDMYWERDPDAIQETDQKYGPLLRNVAYNILSDMLDCEECKNDTYLKIWNTIPSTRPAAFPAFIMQIMRQVAIDRYREKSRKKRIPSQLTISLEELETMSGGLSVEEVCEAKELGRLITKYVEGLNERQRYIFIDRYYLAEPVEKTAADLSISTQIVYREIRKMKHELKEFLEKNGVRV
jgi:RNA polymerase sigma-70 factor (ECF subfamily)